MPEVSYRGYPLLECVLEVRQSESQRLIPSAALAALQLLVPYLVFHFFCVGYGYKLAVQCCTKPVDMKYPISQKSAHLHQGPYDLAQFGYNTLQNGCKLLQGCPISFDIDQLIWFDEEICCKSSGQFVPTQSDRLLCPKWPSWFLHDFFSDIWIPWYPLPFFLH